MANSYKNKLFPYKIFITELFVMRMTRRIPLALVTLMGLSLFGSEKPNVLLIVCDDLRPEAGAYNHSHMSTPNMDKLARYEE